MQSGEGCHQHDALFTPLDIDSSKQRQTALSSVVAFFRANVGTSPSPDLNRNFNPVYGLPSSVQSITRVERGFTPSPNDSSTTVFEDFMTTNPADCFSGSNTCDVGGAPNVSHSVVKLDPYHDPALNVLRLNWSAAGDDKFLQINWRPAGMGASVSDHQTFDFRISRVPGSANVNGATNFSIQLVMANGSLSNAIKLCNYAYVDGPVGKYTTDASTGNRIPEYRPFLQTVRIPLSDFVGANLTAIRGVKITFNESPVGSIHLANLRFMK